MWEILKNFFYDHEKHAWLETHLLYAAIVSAVVIVILYLIYMKKVKKQIKDSDKESVQRRRNIIKLLGRKNKTS